MKVLMAAWQGERFLREQLDSILGQTAGGMHILVSDDLSTDGTPDILAEYEKQYPGQVKHLAFDKPSGGACANFLRLLSYEAGNEGEQEEYYFLSDQDDVWMPDKAERMAGKMREMELRYGAGTPILLHSDMRVAGTDLSEIHPSFFAYQHISPERTGLNQLLVQNPVTGGASMFNRALLSYLKEIPKECFMHDWWLALTACCFGKIGCVEEALSCYRQHGDNTLGAKSSRDLSQYTGRFTRSRDEQVKENYRKMFAQASCFLEQFSSRLSEEQKEVLRAFLMLPSRNVPGRAALIKKYRFYKNTFAGTVAQCVTMGGTWGDGA